jgi:phosphinothricin acetyltransferase
MIIQLRSADEPDLPSILEIYNDAILTTTAVYEYAPHTLAMRAAWYTDKVRLGIPVVVAESDGRVVGFASYGSFRAWPAYQYAVEHSIYVHPEFRRRGIAKLLLQRLIELVREKGMHTLIAGIDAENTHSISLHRSFGFVETGHFREVGFKFGKWLDLKFMQLMLSPDQHPFHPKP